MNTRPYLFDSDAIPTCPCCGGPADSPRRKTSYGKVVEGCIDAFHSDWALAKRDEWHWRPEAIRFRAAPTKWFDAILADYLGGEVLS